MKHYFISFTLLTLVLISGIGCSQNDERDSFKDSTKEVLTKRISVMSEKVCKILLVLALMLGVPQA